MTANDIPISYDLRNLPDEYQVNFCKDHSLLFGYVASVRIYEDFREELLNLLGALEPKIKHLLVMIREYLNTSTRIHSQIILLDQTFKEFITLETYQFQLLASNFNQKVLRHKFRSNTETEATSITVSGCENDSSMPTLLDSLHRFKASRKSHHLRQEKLHRWTDERVSGFV